MAALANISPSHYDSQHEQENSSAKRKAEDGGLPSQRAKRNRYISIACYEVSCLLGKIRIDSVLGANGTSFIAKRPALSASVGGLESAAPP